MREGERCRGWGAGGGEVGLGNSLGYWMGKTGIGGFLTCFYFQDVDDSFLALFLSFHAWFCFQIKAILSE